MIHVEGLTKYYGSHAAIRELRTSSAVGRSHPGARRERCSGSNIGAGRGFSGTSP
jgi:hypothetical protein